MRTALFAICWFLLSILYALVKKSDLVGLKGWNADISVGFILVIIVGVMLFRDWLKSKREE